jgi:hypothetical protein
MVAHRLWPQCDRCALLFQWYFVYYGSCIIQIPVGDWAVAFDSEIPLLKAGKFFFYEEKKQKTFASLSRFSPATYAQDAKVFGSFFQKRTAFLLRLGITRDHH